MPSVALESLLEDGLLDTGTGIASVYTRGAVTSVLLELPASGSVDFPVPAAGFVRVWTGVAFIPDDAANQLTSVSLTIEPAGHVLASPLSSGANGIAGQVIAVPTDETETLRMTNGSAVAGRVLVSYYDAPASSMTLVRQALTTTPATLIPAPAAGFRRCWVAARRDNGVDGVFAYLVRPRNADSVSTNLDYFLGGTIYARNSPLAAGANVGAIVPIGVVQVTATTGALTAATRVAPTTTSPMFFGAWEEIAL